MKQLISVITNQIVQHLRRNEINMVRMESFDNPVIYKSVCENLFKGSNVDTLVPKITMEKYDQFIEANNSNWTQALVYLHKGNNLAYHPMPAAGADYAEQSFVDFNQAITRWRNESPNLGNGRTTLLLLMGTEAAPDDAGSLKDTTFVISPGKIVELLGNDYSEWFKTTLKNNSIDDEKANKALHTLFRIIFQKINVDIFKFSDFIDGLQDMQFASVQELVSYICETLNTTWGIPSIKDRKYVPKVQNLCKGRLTDAKIISNGIQFIERTDDIPTPSARKKLEEKFNKFAEDNEISVSDPFPEDEPQFGSYGEFKRCVIDFKCGIDINANRARLLKVDYSIIERIIGTKLPKKSSKSATTVVGEPMEAYSRIFLDTANQFYREYETFPTNFTLRIDRISLSDCIEDQKEDAFLNVCMFVGGILTFFASAGVEWNGMPVVFRYEEDYDPFDSKNMGKILLKIHSTGKWGDPCKIQLKVKASNNEHQHSYEYRWNFSPYSPWLNAFPLLRTALLSDQNSYTIPSIASCSDIQGLSSCESEDDFYAQLNQADVKILYREQNEVIRRYFKEDKVAEDFTVLCMDFKEFAVDLVDHGLYASMPHLRNVVQSYTVLMDDIRNNYGSFTEVQKEKIALLINCFVISSNDLVVQECKVEDVLLPAYHPVMLEKLDAKQIFLRDGFAELLTSFMDGRMKVQVLFSKFDRLVQLSSITQGTDAIYTGMSQYSICRKIWEYYGIYYQDNSTSQLITGNSVGSSIVSDDEDSAAMLHVTPLSNVVARNMMDYIRTFPARVDGLNVAFVAPEDMQHIVAAIHTVAKQLEKVEIRATINLKIICLNNKKNSASYLKRWLDSYFDDDREVAVNTYLQNIYINNKAETNRLEGLLDNCDICFNYNVLQMVGVQFDRTGSEIINKEQAKFPMTFTPDTISAAHGKARKVSISQFQFLASKSHTQANFVAGNPNSFPGTYRTFKTLELGEIQRSIIELSHRLCKWVVCIDEAVDRGMLETSESRIIGFTTGEGSYGELNVTVSARKDILTDIKSLLTKRIREKFPNWSSDRLEKAAAFCVDEMSQYMDGSRILKALNPYDYEIHNYLAYVLTIQMLGLTHKNDDYAVRALISLDSYKHWFFEDDELSKDNSRPDFMLLEIPMTPENLDPKANLEIQAKIIECKMGFENDGQIEKAAAQLEKGIRTMSMNWNPANPSIMHRYWLNQLYRAIIFSPLNLNSASNEYNVIRDKMFGILSGNYTIKWSGDIFAFWLDSSADMPEEWSLSSNLTEELAQNGIELGEMICHRCGQMFIQKMLVPPEERSSKFVRNKIINPDDLEDPSENENGDEPFESGDNPPSTGKSIPTVEDTWLPFLQYLNDGQEHSRKDGLEWFTTFFSVLPEDKLLIWENNGRPRWELVLDDVIAAFQKKGLLETSEHGKLMITELGSGFSDRAEDLLLKHTFWEAVEAYLAGINVSNGSESACDNRDSRGDQDKEIPPAGRITEDPPTGNPSVPKSIRSARLLLGEDLRTKEKYYWEFGNKNLNNRHLLINGNSGCGKTYCIQGLLMELVHAGVSAVVFDYTSGFTPDKLDPVFRRELGDRVQQRVVYIDKIPVNPFAKQMIKIAGREEPEADPVLATRIANVFTTVYSFGGQQHSALYKAIKNGLKNHKGSMSFAYLEEELENVRQKQAETVLSKIQPFLDLEPFAEGEEFDWGSIRDSGGMVYVMQLDGYDRQTQLLLTELLLWDIWNYCYKNGDEDHPFVVVMDEAQNLSHDENSPSAKFLTEGRKFGISGWYATQFMKPQLSDDEIQRLQQAGQKLYFCPPDDGVMTVAKSIDIDAQGAKAWASKLKVLKKGECVTCGNMVRNDRWTKYDPRVIKVTSLQERLDYD